MSQQASDGADNETAVQTEFGPPAGLLWVKIYTPSKTYYQGLAKSLTAANDSGEFDILPGHHNFITMVRSCDIVVATEQDEKRTIPIRRGLLHIRHDMIVIFLGI